MSKMKKDDELIEESKTKEEQEAEMEVVHASKSDVVAKPTKEVEELAGKAIASKLSEEEQRKRLKDNVIGEFEE